MPTFPPKPKGGCENETAEIYITSMSYSISISNSKTKTTTTAVFSTGGIILDANLGDTEMSWITTSTTMESPTRTPFPDVVYPEDATGSNQVTSIEEQLDSHQRVLSKIVGNIWGKGYLVVTAAGDAGSPKIDGWPAKFGYLNDDFYKKSLIVAGAVSASSAPIPKAAIKRVDQDLYSVLQLPPTAGRDAIKAAYQRLTGANFLENSNRKEIEPEAGFYQIRAAYIILADPTARMCYDAGCYDIGSCCLPQFPPRPRQLSSSLDESHNSDEIGKLERWIARIAAEIEKTRSRQGAIETKIWVAQDNQRDKQRYLRYLKCLYEESQRANTVLRRWTETKKKRIARQKRIVEIDCRTITTICQMSYWTSYEMEDTATLEKINRWLDRLLDTQERCVRGWQTLKLGPKLCPKSKAQRGAHEENDVRLEDMWESWCGEDDITL
ncbi:hypothetical protein G7046_g9821 [Stylonectria norvegica]|nr:hypothetical protein G7046_g9821 [Stylonectria norvegica]